MTEQTPIEVLRRAVAIFDTYLFGGMSISDSEGEKIIADAREALGQVEALYAENDRLQFELRDSAKNVLSLSASRGKKIKRVSELEAEVSEFRLHLEDMGRQVHVRNADVERLEGERARLLLDAALDRRFR